MQPGSTYWLVYVPTYFIIKLIILFSYTIPTFVWLDTYAKEEITSVVDTFAKNVLPHMLSNWIVFIIDVLNVIVIFWMFGVIMIVGMQFYDWMLNYC